MIVTLCWKIEIFLKLGVSDFWTQEAKDPQDSPQVEMTLPSCISYPNQEIFSVLVHCYFPVQISKIL